MSETTDDVNEPLTTWWTQRSCEERSTALVIDDEPFLMTLLHFISLSTTSSDNLNSLPSNDTLIDLNLNLCNWNEEFSTSEIEKVFNMSMNDCVNKHQVTLVSSSILDETKLDTKNSEPQCTLSKQSNDSVVSYQIGDREILNFSEQMTTELNEGRTTLSSGDSNLTPTQFTPSPKVFDSDIENNTDTDNPCREAYALESLQLHGFLNHLSFVLPSVISVSQEHGFRCPPFMSQRKHCPWPILIINPSFVSSFDTALLPPPIFLHQSPSTWLAILRYHAGRFDSRSNETYVPLSLVILSRLQASLLDSYHGSLINLKSSEPLILGESKNEQIIEKTCPMTTNDNLEEEKPSIFKILPELKVIPSVLETEVVPPLPLQDFPLLPFSYIRYYNESRFQEIDQIFENLSLQAFSNLTDTGNLSASSESIEKANEVEVRVSEQSLDSAVTQDSKTVSSKKKKKKKKKKRKVIASEKASGVSEASIEQSLSIERKASIEAKEKPAVAAPNLSSLSPVEEQVILSSEPSASLLDESNVECVNSNSEEIATSDIEFDSNVNRETDINDLSTDVVESTVQPSPSEDTNHTANDQTNLHVLIEPEVDDGDVWETVESKSKNKNRSKNSEFKSRCGSGSSCHSNQAHWRMNSSSARKVKPARTMASRKRNATRKIVRDVLSSVLDSVDTEIRERQQFRGSNRDDRKGRASCDPVSIGLENSDAHQTQTSKPVTLRDVVLGKHSRSTTDLPPVNQKPSGVSSTPYSRIPRGTMTAVSKSINPEMRSKSTQTAVSGADQSTAPTILETLSGASANTLSSLATEEVENLRSREQATGAIIVVDDASSAAAGGEEVESFQTKVDLNKEGDRSPPLQTLLGPGNTNSASSSVASSLEAPHASKHRHHNFSSNENDVGYHLLDVCDRLSRDMNAFMARRAMALSTRRCERNAILVALQETVSKIWQNRGKVELYGSCATLLDLPSSDLDAVILGITPSQDEISTSCRHNSKKRPQRDSVVERNSRLDVQTQNHFPHAYGRLSPNGERVLRLAEELERQAWVVQVKAIPTATVPVVKILADPYKLHGLFDSVHKNWMIQQQQHHLTSDTTSITPGDPLLPQGHTPFPPWRGADVMNGLFSIDITFDGPEHGGIGSTRFSADVVENACAETGLPRDNTPFVQVLMVLKELLAQRRLNEPFSGGLSSYALLLLVYAVVQERAIIREEIECIERHRELVASQDTVNANNKLKKLSLCDHSVSDCMEPVGKSSDVMNGVEARETTSEKQACSNSSWASIAKKNSSQKFSVGNIPVSSKSSTQSFAEALSRNQKTTSQGTISSKFSETFQKNLDSNQTKVSDSSQTKKCNKRVTDKEKSFRPRSPTKAVPPASKEKLQPQSHSNNTTESNLPTDSSLNGLSSVFPQGSDDVLEVLCSGETTAGKLLLHFLLYYGQRFDSRGLAIDVAGNFSNYIGLSNRRPSPYVPRLPGGVIDPVTGMLTVDPIVIYDPWEGGRGNNVARSCYAWSSIQWHFAQCYMTLSSAVERCGASSTNTTIASEMAHKNIISDHLYANPYQIRTGASNNIQDSANVGHTTPANIVSPLLELLISF